MTIIASGGARMIDVDTIESYMNQGRTVTLVAKDSKAAFLSEWQTRVYTLDELRARWKPEMNLGWVTRGEADIDCDSPEALVAADYLAPETGCVWGRTSKPKGHRWYIIDGEDVPSKAFEDPVATIANRLLPKEEQRSAMLVEYRGRNVQSVAPPSVWARIVDGAVVQREPIRFWTDPRTGVVQDAPGRMSAVALQQATGRIAAAALLGRYWAEGERHNATLALAGWLGRHWPDRAAITRFCEAVWAAGGDETRYAELETTFRRLDANENVVGLPRLSDYFAREIIEKVVEWLRLDVTSPNALAREYMENSLGVAARVLDSFGGHLRYVPDWKRWYTWNGRIWEPDVFGMVRRHTQDVGRELVREALVVCRTDEKGGRKLLAAANSWCSAKSVSDVVLSLSTVDGVTAGRDLFDQGDWLMTWRNGTVDIRTGRMRAHDPEDYCTRQVDYDYDEQAVLSNDPLVMPHFNKYLGDTFVKREKVDGEWAPDGELIDWMQRSIGLSLTGETRHQIFWMLYGSGGNGKGTLIRMLENLLGDFVTTASHRVFLGTKADHDTVLADLEGARICITDEAERGELLAAAVVKRFSGEDTIKCRKIGGNPYGYKPKLKLWMVVNHKPVITDDSNGMWRRIKLVPFHRIFGEQDLIYDLDARLLGEGATILMWGVRGGMAVSAEGLTDPEQVRLETTRYKGESDQLAQYIEERCVQGGMSSVQALYDDWTAWAAISGVKPGSKIDFKRSVEMHYPLRMVQGVRMFVGIEPLEKRTTDRG